ncbi:Uncharacterised protein [Mycobacterium tuberculosis]|nr:Uncharacterised protein [Mycobacterium tuberculosis]CKS28939.1 Uncharacterised protein [Mycobacterium tuberculosis]CKS64184.1 Uncharacterised protein [Mycobacterium tuberculosis]
MASSASPIGEAATVGASNTAVTAVAAKPSSVRPISVLN